MGLRHAILAGLGADCASAGVRRRSQTRLKFPRQAELPAIFAVDASGKESLLSLRVDEDGVVMLDHVVSDLVLRQGAGSADLEGPQRD